MGSPETRGVSIWPPFSSSQPGQSKLSSSIRGRHVPIGCVPQMAGKRKISSKALASSFGVRPGLEHNPINVEDATDNENAIFMSAHLEMLEKFMRFCSEKKLKYDQEHHIATSSKLHEDKKLYLESNTFKERVTSYFGEYFPYSVVDELCLLVEDNSYGKCHYYSLPAESLVLSLLQILLNASHNFGTKYQSSQGVPQNCNNETHNSKLCGKAVSDNNMPNGNHPVDQLHDSQHENPFPTLDTPGFMLGSGIKSQQVPTMPHNSKCQSNHFITGLRKPATPATNAASHEVYIWKETKSKDIRPDMEKLVDQMYNKKNVNVSANRNTTHVDHYQFQQLDESSRFKVSESEIRYYKVICDLAHSDFRGIEGVQLFKTSVTYSSLGQSLQPSGQVDNFFHFWILSEVI